VAARSAERRGEEDEEAEERTKKCGALRRISRGPPPVPSDLHLEPVVQEGRLPSPSGASRGDAHTGTAV